MKNLNKKIGAVLLAGMVVAGGFAASGAQSFAFYELQQNEEKINSVIQNSDYKLVEFHGSLYDAENAAEESFSSNYGFKRVVPYRWLKRVVNSKQFGSFILKMNNSQFYIIARKGVQSK